MSKALEENGGVTHHHHQQQQQQQTPECTCGLAHRAKLERHPSAATGRRSSLDNHKGGGLHPNSPSGASSSRAAAAAAAAASPSLQGARSLRDGGRSGDVKSTSLHGERKLRDRAKNGDVQQPKPPLGPASSSLQDPKSLRDNRRSSDEQQQQAKSTSVDASPPFQWESSLRDSRGRGYVQQPKSPSGNASPSPCCEGEWSLRDSRRNGDLLQAKSLLGSATPCCQGERSSRGSRILDVQKANSPLVNGSASFQEGKSSRGNRRSGEEQQPKSPSGNVSPSQCCEGEWSLRDTRGNGDLLQATSLLGSASPCCQGERSLGGSGILYVQKANSPLVDGSASFQEEKSLKHNRTSGDEQQPKSPSVNGCPSCQGERSSRDNRRSGNVQLAKSSSVDASPSLQEAKSLTDRDLRDGGRNGDLQLPNSPSVNASSCWQGEGSLKDNRRSGDEQQQAKSRSVDVSPPFERVRSLRDSIRNGDLPLFKSPSLASSSRATPIATSPSILKRGDLGESVKFGGAHANSAPAASPSRAAPTNPSSTCPSLKSKLAAGHKLYGASLVSFSTVVAEILGWAGYDFVVVDFEQLFPGDTFAALPVLQALASTGTPAIFRLSGDDPVLVNKALDMGPSGLMFSMIENEEAARNAVASCRYPPRGTRRGSRHAVSRASRYGLDPSYMDRCEEELLVICQVETMDAVDHIMGIAGIEGVDCIQMGGLDFGASLGDPYLDYNKEKILARQRKVLLAGFATPESSPDALFKRGYHLVSGAVDVVLLRNAAVADLQRNKPLLNT